MTPIYESDIEHFVIELLEKQGFEYLSPEQQETERGNLRRGRIIKAAQECHCHA